MDLFYLRDLEICFLNLQDPLKTRHYCIFNSKQFAAYSFRAHSLCYCNKACISQDCVGPNECFKVSLS